MRITRSFAGVLILFTLTASLMAEPASQPTTPRSWGHAYNDYKHKRPLLDALSSGFVSVEVDVFPVDGELLVGHDRHELQPGRNLETLYLKPLVERIKNKRAEVLKDANTFTLLIDFKDDGGTAYALLNEKIKPYRNMLTKFGDTTTEINAITIVITGKSPNSKMEQESERWAGYDGFVSDLGGKHNRHLMPWVSGRWGKHFRWNGKGDFSEAERAKLTSFVKQAHANGQKIRFWGAPDSLACWTVLQKAGVDFINTDRLKPFATFLNTNDTEVRNKRCHSRQTIFKDDADNERFLDTFSI